MKPRIFFDIKKLINIVIISAMCGLVVSFGWSMFNYYRSGDDRGKNRIEEKYIEYNSDIQKNTSGYSVSKNGGKITITFPQSIYISKLQYEYNTPVSSEHDAEITVYKKNIYGDNDVEIINDNYFKGLSRSVVNINKEVLKIEITFPEGNETIGIKNFCVDNSFKWNPYIFGVICVSVFLSVFLILFRKEIVLYPGRTVFICTLILGCCILILQPPFCTGWDEQIHFSRSYHMAVTREPEGIPNVLYYLIDNAPWINEHNQISLEERADLIRNMNYLGATYGLKVDGYSWSISSIGYIFQAAAITVGRFLHLPFYLIWLLGKFSNVLLYSLGMGMAVSITPIGKKLLAVLSVMPTMIFTSTVYTYDITVNVFIVISICIFLRELLNKDTYFETKWRIAYFASMVVGCMPKAVYAPLILNVLLMPRSKFKSSRDERIFKTISVLVFLLAMSTFVLPTLISPDAGGDARGGDTSVATQISYVFGQPVAYAIVLLKNMGETFLPFVFSNAVNNFAYCGTMTFPFLYTALLVGMALTDTYHSGKPGKCELTIKNRAVVLFFIFATMSLIWTALYLSFTEVGETVIAGVQPRYYLPFLFLLYICFRTGKIQNRLKEENYQMGVMLLACGLLMTNIFDIFILRSCL